MGAAAGLGAATPEDPRNRIGEGSVWLRPREPSRAVLLREAKTRGLEESVRKKRTAEKRGPPPSAPVAPCSDGAAGFRKLAIRTGLSVRDDLLRAGLIMRQSDSIRWRADESAELC